ncbi:hypothetical protein EHQ53_14090 [Leptospira langatensis]|uniref:Uncharacterized protein n=1 Tax=Leptospira langatensis TaxID=2484983 RepID=A0ABY2M9A8_9LEPT|nr:hypothetical protein [Leptospira langatensis]TGL39648.1 hypothetical protein EHQ53_14090 [Leptospira langatensis]
MIYYSNDEYLGEIDSPTCVRCEAELTEGSVIKTATIRFVEDLQDGQICIACAREVTQYKADFDAKIASVPVVGKSKFFWASDRLVTI